MAWFHLLRSWLRRQSRRQVIATGLVSLVVVTGFVVLRLVFAGHGNASNFALVGLPFAHGPGLPRGVVLHRRGYDGQYFLRLALDPFQLGRRAFGIGFDAPYRASRIGYPLLAWLLSGGGRPAAVPWALIAINVASMGALGAEGAILAGDAGRRRWWGLLLPGFSGLVTAVARDTAEPLELACTVAAVILLRRKKPWLAGALLVVAVLSKETAILAVAAIAMVDLARRARAWGETKGLLAPAGNTRPSLAYLFAWLSPAVAMIGWQAVLWMTTGHFPLTSDTHYNATIPLTGIRRAIVVQLHHLPALQAVGFFAEVALVAMVWGWAIAAATSKPLAGPSRGTVWAERIAFGANLLLALILPSGVWNSPLAAFRPLADSFVLAIVVILGSRTKLAYLSLPIAILWGVFAAYRVLVL